MAYIYAIDLQEFEDVAVRRNIAKDSSWVRNRVKTFAIACALGIRRKFDPRSGIAIRFDPRGYRGSFFLPFFTGHISWNPVNSGWGASSQFSHTTWEKWAEAPHHDEKGLLGPLSCHKRGLFAYHPVQGGVRPEKWRSARVRPSSRTTACPAEGGFRLSRRR